MNKPLTFIPGESIGHGSEHSPAIVLRDGSMILLTGYDPVCGDGRHHKRAKERRPDTLLRNALGGALVAAYNATLAATPKPARKVRVRKLPLYVFNWANQYWRVRGVKPTFDLVSGGVSVKQTSPFPQSTFIPRNDLVRATRVLSTRRPYAPARDL